MTYHQDFWIAVAAAVPVIGVAVAVTLPSLLENLLNTSFNASFDLKGWAKARAYAGVGVSVLIVVWIILFMCALLWEALHSLANERDQTSPNAVVGNVIITFGAVFAYTLIGTLAALSTRLEEKRRDK